MAFIIGTEVYQIAEDVLGGETIMYHRLPTEYENKPKPVKVEGKCCAKCVHRYGDKMDYCVRHNHDDKCYRFKLGKDCF